MSLATVSRRKARRKRTQVIGHPEKKEIEEKRYISIAKAARPEPWFVTVGNDTIYRYADEGPVFDSTYADVYEYLEEAVKDIHIGEGISYVSFVVNKAGLPCYVSIKRSAINNVFDAEISVLADLQSASIEYEDF